ECFSVTTEGVHRTYRRFTTPGYEFVELHLTAKQLSALRSFFIDKVDKKCGFNYIGFYFNFILLRWIWTFTGNGKRYFCSQFLPEGSSKVGAIKATIIDCARMSPDALLSVVKKVHDVYVAGNPNANIQDRLKSQGIGALVAWKPATLMQT